MTTAMQLPTLRPQARNTSIPLFGTLSPAECENLLRRNHVGRLAYALHDRVNVTAVHYQYADGWLYGRTAPGGKLLTILRNRWVAFEVDESDGLFDWRSVVVHGALYVIETGRSAHERAIYDRALDVLRGLVPGTFDATDPVRFRNQLFRIRAAEVTGRFAVSHGGVAAPASDAGEVDLAVAEDDEALRCLVREALDPFIGRDKLSVHVDVHDSVVVLGGCVPDARARATMEGAIVQLPGVHALVQQLETEGPTTAELAPSEMAQRAIRALRQSPLPAGSNVTVVVDHNWLRLEGSVTSPTARLEIRRRLENIPGARGFVDRLIIETEHR